VGASVKLERQSFGLVLRAGRERRKVSLAQLSRETGVRAEIWAALEENDLSSWPRGIYARSLIRQYAERVDLDPDELVNEFCRLFPHGDRRRDALLRDYAALVAHDMTAVPAAAVEAPRRRTGDPVVIPSWRDVLAARAPSALAVAIDVAAVLAAGRAAAFVLGYTFWPSLAMAAIAYHGLGSLAVGRSCGSMLVERASARLQFKSPRQYVNGWPIAGQPARLE
jgi:hypothetical protein